jgi:uncharacterized protein
MEWLNEPSSWQRTGDVLTVSVDPSTDFWRETGYGYIRDSGHVYGEVLAGDLDVSVRLRCVLEAQYDQAGVMLRADEQTWLKTGIEFFEGRPRLSTVLTLGRSSWMVTDLPGGSDDILLRVSRRGDAVEVRYLVGDGQPELAALVYMPPDRAVLAGVMCAAPEGPGFRVSFHDLQIAERDWSAPGDEGGDWAGETAWAGDDGGSSWAGDSAGAWPNGTPAGERRGWDGQEPAPAWDGGQQEGERPDWASGAASEDHPSWPAGGVTAVDETDWAAEMAEEDDPDWPKKLAMEDDPDWATGISADVATGDSPGWAESPATEDGPGWVESRQDGPGGAPTTDHAVTDQLAEPGDPLAPPGAAPPGEPAACDKQTWAPAPVLEDAVADWDRLAAGVHAGGRTAPAERWTAQTDADVANEWPGPPLRAARRAAITSSLTAVDGSGAPPGREPPAPPAAAGPAAPAGSAPPAPAADEPAAPAEAEPPPGPASGSPNGQTGNGLAPAGPKEPAHAKRRKSAPARPPVDLPSPPDPADEWISLLTADPAEE